MNITDINKLDHPWLSKQTDQGVLAAATGLYNEYHGKKGIAFRDACSAFVEQVATGKLDYVDADGKPLTGTEAENRKTIITKILGEMDVPASTLRLWGFQRKVRLTYPKPVRDAAEKAPLNLALNHVRAAYEEMLLDKDENAKPPRLKPGLLFGKTPEQLEQMPALEAGGIVLELKKAKKPKPLTDPTSESTGIERFDELLSEAFEYAKDDGSITYESELVTVFSRVFRLTNRAKSSPELIRYCMNEAAKLSLTKDGIEVWQKVVTLLGQEEKKAEKARAAGAAAGAGTASDDSVIDVDAISADAAAAKKK